MNTAKVIKELYDKIDILSESKQMHNRFYVSRANRLVEKLKLHQAKTKRK